MGLFFLNRHSLVEVRASADLPVCLQTLPKQNWPSAHDAPSFLEGPSVGHMAFSWATSQASEGVPLMPEGQTKNLQWEAVSSSSPPLLSLFGLQTELNAAAAHTWRPRDPHGTFSNGWNQQQLTLQRNRKPQRRVFPPFLSSQSVSHALLSSFSDYFFNRAVDGAWEYLLCSCCQ